MGSYNLCYEDYTANLSSGLQSMLSKSHFSDVTLAVDGKLFKAHQMILAMFSPYFEELFMANDCHHKHIILCLMNVKHEIVRALLAFIYEGKVEIHASDLEQFVKTALEMKIKGLESDGSNVAFPNTLNIAEKAVQPNVIAVEEVENLVVKTVDEIEQTTCDSQVPSNLHIEEPLEDDSNHASFNLVVKTVEESEQTTSDSQMPSNVDMEESFEDNDDNASFNEEDETIMMNVMETKKQSSRKRTAEMAVKTRQRKMSRLCLKVEEDVDNEDHDEITNCEGDEGSENANANADHLNENGATANEYLKVVEVNVHEPLANLQDAQDDNASVQDDADSCQDDARLENSADSDDDDGENLDNEDFEDSDMDADYVPDASNSDSDDAEENSNRERSIIHDQNDDIPISSSSQRAGDTVTVYFFKTQINQKNYAIKVNGLWYTPKCNNKWLCLARNRSKCRASIALTNDKEIIFMHEHNHSMHQTAQPINVEYEESYTILAFSQWCNGGRKSRRAALKFAHIDEDDGTPEAVDNELVTVSFVKSPRKQGMSAVIVNDARFTLECNCKLWTRWQCTANRWYKCKASLILTEDERIVFVHAAHNHERTARCRARVDSVRVFSVLSYKTWCCVARPSMLAASATLKQDVAHQGNITVSFVRGRKSQKTLSIVVDGFRYSAKPKQKNWSRWRCASRVSRSCAARIILIDDGRIVFINQHNHAEQNEVPRSAIESQATFVALPFEEWHVVKQHLVSN